jgi:hypothetical protein
MSLATGGGILHYSSDSYSYTTPPGQGRGEAVQVNPVKPTLKAPKTKRLKPKSDAPLSIFAFNFNLRRYSVGCVAASWPAPAPAAWLPAQ